MSRDFLKGGERKKGEVKGSTTCYSVIHAERSAINFFFLFNLQKKINKPMWRKDIRFEEMRK